MTQIKGDGEAHPFLSPNDEFAGYEIWDKFNLNMSVPKEKGMLQYEYARTALQIGLQLEAKLGTNPVQVRHDRLDRHATPASPPPTRTTSSASTAGTEPNAKRMEHPVGCFGENCILGWSAGRVRLRRRLGDARTRARRSSMPWSARRPMRPPVRG